MLDSKRSPCCTVKVWFKKGRNIVTAADKAVNQLRRETLPEQDDGWLSVETADDLSRLRRGRVWIVDLLDGTKEFLAGIPEWCVSIGLVEDGKTVAGGVLSPSTGEMIVGSIQTGVVTRGLSHSFRIVPT